MAPRWRLEVEGLGRIERAEVDIYPLMLFVGPNNTGKSYLASLLWGLLAMQGSIEPPEGPALQACDEWLARHISEGSPPVELELSPGDIELFDRLWAEAVAASRDRLAASIFNNDAVRVDKLGLRNVSGSRWARLKWSRVPRGAYILEFATGDGSQELRSYRQGFEPVLDQQGFDQIRAEVRTALMRGVSLADLSSLIRKFERSFRRNDPVYLPASRTGFMQLYKAPVRLSLRAAFRPEPEDSGWLDLTAPAFKFIDMLALGLKPAKQPGPFAEEADLLEEALAGRVELISGDVGINEYRYVPRSSQLSLSMSLSSSLVTELAPLVVVLRHLSDIPILILEEPEAHLHIELQRLLAQVVVRLIRKGVYVWITTHSENFCQEINNFIKLGSLERDRRAAAQQHLGYEPQDYLELDDVVGYQFKLDDAGQRSSVVEMEKTPYGLAMPTFNAAILRLTKDVDYLDQLVAGE